MSGSGKSHSYVKTNLQIHEEAKKFSYQTGVRVVVTYGGAPIHQQVVTLVSSCVYFYLVDNALSFETSFCSEGLNVLAANLLHDFRINIHLTVDNIYLRIDISCKELLRIQDNSINVYVCF